MRTTVSTLSFSDSPRKADSRTTVLPSLKRCWQDVSVDWIIARAGDVRDIHIRQRQRQVLNERAHAFERAHLRIHERAAEAPGEFNPAVPAFKAREAAVRAFVETRLATATARAPRSPMAERIQLEELACQAGGQDEVFAHTDLIECQRRGIE